MNPGPQAKQPGNLRAHDREIWHENAKTAGKMTITVDLKTDSAELVLNVGAITLGRKNRKKMRNQHPRKEENENISQVVCALLNSGGGVIEGKIENENHILTRDKLGQNLEASLCKCLPFVAWHIDFTEHGGNFFIFVKARSVDMFVLPIATLRTNLYTRSMSLSIEMNATAALQFLLDLEKNGGRTWIRPELPASRACPGVRDSDLEHLAAAVFNKTQFQHQEDFPLARSTYVEVTSISVKQVKRVIKKLIPQIASSFANTDGGYLFIGLDGKKQQIIGFEAKESQREKIKREIEKCIQQLPVVHFCEEKHHIKYTCKFTPVLRSGAECSYVCALRVERFCCAVFTAEPDSWHVEDGCVKRFTSEQWVTVLMSSRPGP